MKRLIPFLLASFALTAQTRTAVLLELFTSEGCSSCPPADDLLAKIDSLQPLPNVDLIVLSEHVDYWDGAHRDRFSQAALTRRQSEYAKTFGLKSIYTPQLVVDGTSEMVGGGGRLAEAAILKAVDTPKHPMELKATPNGKKLSVSVRFAKLGTPNAIVYLAVADNHAETKVSAGENAGRTLHHTAVVRAMMQLGKAGASDFDKTVELPLKTDSRVVAFIQDPATGKVLAAAQVKL